MLKVVTINGSPQEKSKTGVLLSHISKSINRRIEAQITDINLSDPQRPITSYLMRNHIPQDLEQTLQEIESANLMVIGTPVYRGSYSGILKHLFDLVDRDAMRSKIALLAATGGSSLHGLVIDHQLRPLMAFFGVHSVPTSLYAVPEDFEELKLKSSSLVTRIERATEEACSLVAAGFITREKLLRHESI
jgi:FMN reductase